MSEKTTMEDIVSLAKRRGFIFPGSAIYGGLAGMWDYGPRGVALKENVVRAWQSMFVDERDDVYKLDAAILMNEKVWEASGHTGAGFSDPLVACEKCNKRFRQDHIDAGECPECGGALGETQDFNLMFETKVGAHGAHTSYLRPETAQGIFVNFKNVVDSMQPPMPFGIAQVGKAFRNEIAPRDFVFRAREFEQMEIEYFVPEAEWEQYFTHWYEHMKTWMARIGLDEAKVHELEVPEKDRAHYSARTVDFEYDFPFGRSELYGLAYRSNHDLKSHMDASGEKLTYTPAEGEPFVPHVIEPTFGLDRTVLALLCDAYTVDEINGEERVCLKLHPDLAPVRVAVFPLLKNKPELVARAREVYDNLKKTIPNIAFDDHGNVGKRYRRQDEIGTPWCVTIDFDTLEDDTVTVRDRDTGEQERVNIAELTKRLK